MENKFTNKTLKSLLSFSLVIFLSLFSLQSSAQCTSGIGANQEGFETAGANFFQGPWTSWSLDATSSSFTGTNAWRSLSGATGSFGTGPSGPSEGNYYVYCETSGQYNRVANLVSTCVDLSNFTAPVGHPRLTLDFMPLINFFFSALWLLESFFKLLYLFFFTFVTVSGSIPKGCDGLVGLL